MSMLESEEVTVAMSTLSDGRPRPPAVAVALVTNLPAYTSLSRRAAGLTTAVAPRPRASTQMPQGTPQRTG